MNIEEIIKKVKEKKELHGIPNYTVLEIINKKSRPIRTKLSELKKADLKYLVKAVRAELRLLVGRFSINPEEKEKVLEQGITTGTNSILRTSRSTIERLEDYSLLIKIIRDLNVKSVLDLGCGINPIAIANKEIRYYAYDINQSDLNTVQKFFDIQKINGKTALIDLKDIKEKLPTTDICFLFKVLDLVDKKGHKKAEEIIKKVNSKYLLISFSTKTLSGKSMNHPQRGWIEMLLSRLGFKFNIIRTKNEIFYLAEKNN